MFQSNYHLRLQGRKSAEEETSVLTFDIEDGGNTLLWNVGWSTDYTALYLRRWQLLYSLFYSASYIRILNVMRLAGWALVCHSSWIMDELKRRERRFVWNYSKFSALTSITDDSGSFLLTDPTNENGKRSSFQTLRPLKLRMTDKVQKKYSYNEYHLNHEIWSTLSVTS
jgi:hypothetical protein